MLPILNLGPLALPVPPLIVLMGVWIGLDLTENHARYFNASAEQIYKMTLAAIGAGVVGARLVYAAQSPAFFLANPINLLSPRPQMLEPTGGVITGIAAAFGYGWARKLALWPTLDALTTFLSILAVTLGLAHFASGDAFGAPTTVPWAIDLWGEQRHPSQVYETLSALAIAATVWPTGRIARTSTGRAGLRFWCFLALSAGARLFLETFRGDSILLGNMFRQAQVIAWLALAVSLWQIGRVIAPSPLPPFPREGGND